MVSVEWAAVLRESGCDRIVAPAWRTTIDDDPLPAHRKFERGRAGSRLGGMNRCGCRSGIGNQQGLPGLDPLET